MHGLPDQPDTPSVLTIAGHPIGAGTRAFVIAEAGVNHNGSVESALRLIDAAKQSGADAVKFQLFHAEDLVSPSAPAAEYQRRCAKASSQRALLQGLELPPGAWATIKARCDELGIVFLATPFGLRELETLFGMGVAAIKIASTDLTNTPLVDAAIRTGLPMILSTGASTIGEITGAVDLFRRAGAVSRLVLLHCISCYPTPIDELNLGAIATLRRTFHVPSGLSDHTTSTQTGAWAVAAGASVVEKHFTLDRMEAGPDHAMSLNPEQLTGYVTRIRAVERALGDGQLGMRDAELEVRTVASRSIVARRDIAVGTMLTDDLLTLKRPGTGLSPSAMPGLVGHRAATDIKRDTLLSWDMVQ